MATPAEPQRQDEPEEPPRSGPLRRCLVTREILPRTEMLRFVAAPDGQVVFDAAATLPGRGLWLSASGDVIDRAIRSGAFSRAAKAQLKAPPEFRALVAARLTARIVDLLGLARRGGGAVAGFEKAREWMAVGRAGLVLQAADGSDEERARFLGHRDLPAVTALNAAALGKIFGRDHTVHVAVAPGRLAVMLQDDVKRLAGVAGDGSSGQSGPRAPGRGEAEGRRGAGRQVARGARPGGKADWEPD